MFCAHLISFTIISPTFARCLEEYSRFIHWIAGATFTLYLIHLPDYALLGRDLSFAEVLALECGLVDIDYTSRMFCVAEAFERRKDAWRQLYMGGVYRPEVYLPRLRKP